MDTLNLKVDLSQERIRDLVLFEKMRTADYSDADLLEYLNRVVVGGANDLPLNRLGEVMRAIGEARRAAANPKSAEKTSG